MSLRGWLSGKAGQLTNNSHGITEASLERDLEEAMLAANYIFDDDLEAAEKGLGDGSSSFHKLGRGLTAFIKATLGFEQDAMKDAREYLAAAEASALNDQKQVSKEPEAFRSKVYSQGSEYALVTSQAQLMAAVVGVLNESLAESLKGFYKARKAYLVLDSIIAAEDKFMKDVGRTPISAPTSPHVATRPAADSDSDDEVFVDAEEIVEDASKAKRIPWDEGHNGVSVPSDEKSSTGLSNSGQTPNGSNGGSISKDNSSHLQTQLPAESDLNGLLHPIDLFIHSGTNMCFGMLLLILSMIPPTFAKLLWIIGFQGDRDRGLRLLWNASQFNNINGATAGLVILAYYDTFVGFCDILPPDALSDGTEASQGLDASYPVKRLESLLLKMRERYSKSRLWIIEQARMQGFHRNLDGGIQLLLDTPQSPLKQVQALALFERSLQSLYAHRYALCAESFLECCKISNWSPTLYYYIAACTYVQRYRDAQEKGGNEDAIQYDEKATDLFTRAKNHTGKKKFLARQLPFEVFVVRKMAKWEARMSAHGLSRLVDAIGVAPGEEITYHFSGYKKMNETQRAKSRANLQQSEQYLQKQAWAGGGSSSSSRDTSGDKNGDQSNDRSECADEHAVLALLRASIARAAGQGDEALDLLEKKVLVPDTTALFRGEGHPETWVVPFAHYETAATLWAQREQPMRRDGAGATAAEAGRMRSVQGHLERAAKCESGYDLEARMGIRLTMGLNTTRAWLAKYPG